MYIKRYTVAVLIFIMLAGWYIYAFVSAQSITPVFFKITLPSLPIAVWVSILLLLVYFISLLHFSYYSIVGSLRLRKYKKDHDKLIDSIAAAYLKQENRSFNYKTPRYKLLGEIVQESSMYFDGDVSNVRDSKLEPILKVLQKIKNQEPVDLKKYNLSQKNPFVIANNFNKYKAKNLEPEEILKKSDLYSMDLCILAYNDLSKIASYDTILKYKNYVNKDIIFIILRRMDAKDNKLKLSQEQLIDIITFIDLEKKDYIEISKILSLSMLPEDRISVFEKLSEKNEKIMPAYLFTLFDLEMLSVADEVLENTQDNEYESFKAYRALKLCNQNYNISLFT